MHPLHKAIKYKYSVLMKYVYIKSLKVSLKIYNRKSMTEIGQEQNAQEQVSARSSPPNSA